MGKISLNLQVAAGVILVVVGTLVLLTDYIKEKRDVVFSEMNLALSDINDTASDIPQEPEEEATEEETKPEETYAYEDYLGIIEIEKIGLYKGFYAKNSSLNNVQFNLYVLPESDYPDVNIGNLMIAGHSGNYNNSYFNTLYKLVLNDTINLYYKNSTYTYQIAKIYNVPKTGTAKILRNKNKSVLTLITCTKDDEAHQTIYIAELISKK